MKPTEDEIRFSKQRRRIWNCICETCEKVERALEVQYSKLSANMDSVVGTLQSDTLSGQQFVMKRSYATANGNERTFELSVGHTGDRWDPVVTVLDEGGATHSILFDGDLEKGIRELKADIYRRIDACSAK